MNPTLAVGTTFPDIELPDADGVLQRLSEIQGHHPMAVVFYRGQF
jgi:peroxiredoxin